MVSIVIPPVVLVVVTTLDVDPDDRALIPLIPPPAAGPTARNMPAFDDDDPRSVHRLAGSDDHLPAGAAIVRALAHFDPSRDRSMDHDDFT